MKTVFSLPGLQSLSLLLQRIRRREFVAWCHVPPFLAGFFSLASVSKSWMQGISSGSVKFVVVRPLPRSLAKVRPERGVERS